MSSPESNGHGLVVPGDGRLPPFDPKRGGFVCRRIGHQVLTNVPMRVIHHSPDGPEWGYGGSGPADLALNYCHAVFPPGCDGERPQRLWKGKCSTLAWRLHQAFKWKWVATLPHPGGERFGHEVRVWLMNEVLGLENLENQEAASRAALAAWYAYAGDPLTDCFGCDGCGKGWTLKRGDPKERTEAALEDLLTHVWDCPGPLLDNR
jgi:hypothetical protein